MTVSLTRRTTCAVCGAALPKRRRVFCSLTCSRVNDHTQFRRRYRERPDYRAKQLARLAAYRHHRTPQPCEVCGKPGHRHHDRYDRPTEIRWVCPIHHAELHRRRAA